MGLIDLAHRCGIVVVPDRRHLARIIQGIAQRQRLDERLFDRARGAGAFQRLGRCLAGGLE